MPNGEIILTLAERHEAIEAYVHDTQNPKEVLKEEQFPFCMSFTNSSIIGLYLFHYFDCGLCSV